MKRASDSCVGKVQRKMLELADLGEFSTIEQLADPLLNAENNVRVPFFREGKEMGTTIPKVLFKALSLKLFITHELVVEGPELRKLTVKTLRQLLGDIHWMSKLEQCKDMDILVSKTLQEVVFLSLTKNNPLLIDDVAQLKLKDGDNKAHIVCGNGSPTFTIPAYLCRYLLSAEGMNEKCAFSVLNPMLKETGRDVFSKLHGHDRSVWVKQASFSRRVQNHILFEALKKEAFDEDELEIKLSSV